MSIIALIENPKTVKLSELNAIKHKNRSVFGKTLSLIFGTVAAPFNKVIERKILDTPGFKEKAIADSSDNTLGMYKDQEGNVYIKTTTLALTFDVFAKMLRESTFSKPMLAIQRDTIEALEKCHDYSDVINQFTPQYVETPQDTPSPDSMRA